MGNVSLKPCPFCSSWDLYWGGGSFECRGCGVQFGVWTTQDEANTVWNTRKLEEAQAEEIERLRGGSKAALERVLKKVEEMETADCAYQEVHEGWGWKWGRESVEILIRDELEKL